jgi:hypothetical protein
MLWLLRGYCSPSAGLRRASSISLASLERRCTGAARQKVQERDEVKVLTAGSYVYFNGPAKWP